MKFKLYKGNIIKAGETSEKERGLPDAPEMPDRLSLVDAHHGEAGQIDHGEI